MKKLIFILLLLAFSVWLGWKIQQDSGYVLVTYGHWSIECSLWTAIILLLLLFIVLYFCFRFIARSSALAQRWSRSCKRQATRR